MFRVPVTRVSTEWVWAFIIKSFPQIVSLEIFLEILYYELAYWESFFLRTSSPWRKSKNLILFTLKVKTHPKHVLTTPKGTYPTKLCMKQHGLVFVPSLYVIRRNYAHYLPLLDFCEGSGGPGFPHIYAVEWFAQFIWKHDAVPHCQ